MPYVANQGTSIPLSNQSKNTANTVQTFNRRAPVGYNRGFADQYRPNKDFTWARQKEINWQILQRQQAQRSSPPVLYQAYVQRLLIDLSWIPAGLKKYLFAAGHKRLLSRGEAAAGKSTAEADDLNHKEAIEFMVSTPMKLTSTVIPFKTYTPFFQQPAAGSRGVWRLRSYTVGIKKSVYANGYSAFNRRNVCADTGQNGCHQKPSRAGIIYYGSTPYLQPFEDVNKRVSRLALISH